MINIFAQFVGAYFKSIQPLSNFDIIGMCNKLKIKNFRRCFMRDEINSLKYNRDECFVMNTDDSSSSGTDGRTFYFDSYGLEPTMEINKYCKKNLAFITLLKFRSQTK